MRRDRRIKILIIALLLISVSGIAIGFAAYSTTLTISSEATVRPDAGDLSVKFSSSETSIETNNIVPTLSSEDLSATEATINNYGVPTISNFALSFSQPGDKATYTFYARNIGEYDAYLNSITFNNILDKTVSKSCKAIGGTTQSTVDDACDDIILTLQVGSTSATETNTTISNHILNQGSSEQIILTIEYLPNGGITDGDFTVEFGNISLFYNTIDDPSQLTQLPLDYQQVEYIESTGTQWIDTGIAPNQDTGFDIVFLTKNEISITYPEYGSIMGARQNSAVNELQISTFKYGANATTGLLRFGNASYIGGIIVQEKMQATLLNGLYSSNDKKYTLDKEFQSPCNLTVFALNNNGQKVQHGKLQLYSLKLYQGSTLVRDFMPCYRKSDGVIGLYDLENDIFYTNGGSGVFLKGSDI